MSDVIHCLSLGAGLQSSTLALMFARGEVTPMPDAAIFADTGAEPEAVYRQVAWLENLLPYPVYQITWRDGLLANIFAAVNDQHSSRFASVPFYTTSPNGKGMLRRQCTREFKLQPIERVQRFLLGVGKGERMPKNRHCYVYQGITTNEAHRMRDNPKHWQTNCYPLIDRRMSRGDCAAWLERHGYPQAPKSSCTFCPYHSEQQWRALSDKDMAQAIEVDNAIRENWGKTKEKLFVRGDLVPLEDMPAAWTGPGTTQDMFGEECDGICGT